MVAAGVCPGVEGTPSPFDRVEVEGGLSVPLVEHVSKLFGDLFALFQKVVVSVVDFLGSIYDTAKL